MTDKRVSALVARFSPVIPEGNGLILRNALENVVDEGYSVLVNTKLKSTAATVMLSVFLGAFGADRFYVGDIGFGVAKLLLGWATMFLWQFIDIFVTYKRAKAYNMRKLLDIIAGLPQEPVQTNTPATPSYAAAQV